MPVFKQPLVGFFFTCEPKGHKASNPSFSDCRPKGMPMMVIIMARLATRYSMAISMPPNTSQMMLPNNFISRSFKLSMMLLAVHRYWLNYSFDEETTKKVAGIIIFSFIARLQVLRRVASNGRFPRQVGAWSEHIPR